jgi:hypothetical protein
MSDFLSEQDKFEQQLRQAMRPVDAPEGFAARIMALAADSFQPPARIIPMRPRLAGQRLQMWVTGAIAAALLVGVFSVEQVHERREREQAQQQFDAAMRITDRALNQTRTKLERAGIRLGN